MTTTDLKRFAIGVDCSGIQPHTIRVMCNKQEWVLSSDPTVGVPVDMSDIRMQSCTLKSLEF